MARTRESPGGFRRRLLHGRAGSIATLLAMLPQDAISAEELDIARLSIGESDLAVLLLDRPLHGILESPPPEGLGEGADRLAVLLVGERSGPADAFWPPRVAFSLPDDAPEHHVARAVRSLFRFLEERFIATHARRSLAERNRDVENLNQIGIALAAETDPGRLIGAILSRARDLTQADAGSLYLVEERDGAPSLRFAAAQNDSVRVPFAESFVPLDRASLAGYVASTGETLRLNDVYKLDASSPYAFNPAFDEAHGYRTRSMLVVPMKNPQGRVLGVLQLMNRKRRVVPDMTTTAFIRIEKVPFDDDNETIARSLASQAAVALENARLTEHLKRLFDGFVAASVTAIEQRDPTTSGHSQRVATLSCALARSADAVQQGAYSPFRISEQELTALRYAAVLHDFGKVGVREWVLVKARKLPPGRIAFLGERFERARAAVAARLWERAARGEVSAEECRAGIVQEVATLDRAWKAVLAADEPSVLPLETAHLLDEAQKLTVAGAEEAEPLLSPEDQKFLSIPKGSLNEVERTEIESHVTQTYRFLSQIPWTPELSRVPEMAYLHHEKLDGSGYPRGLTAADLPPAARMMTICDIYDALSASDRPYKRAVPRDRALDILADEAKRGALDRDLLDIFIEAKVYESMLNQP